MGLFSGFDLLMGTILGSVQFTAQTQSSKSDTEAASVATAMTPAQVIDRHVTRLEREQSIFGWIIVAGVILAGLIAVGTKC